VSYLKLLATKKKKNGVAVTEATENNCQLSKKNKQSGGNYFIIIP